MPTVAPTGMPTVAPPEAPTAGRLETLRLNYANTDTNGHSPASSGKNSGTSSEGRPNVIRPLLVPSFSAVEQNYQTTLRSISESTDTVFVSYSFTSNVTMAVQLKYKNSITDNVWVDVLSPDTAIPLPQDEMSVIQVFAKDPSARSDPGQVYDIYATRKSPLCLDKQLSPWNDWSDCVATCGSQGTTVVRTRTIQQGKTCSAILAEAQQQHCGSLECGASLAGTLTMNQISKQQFQTHAFAFRVSVAKVSGAKPTDVSILSVTEAVSRRALSIIVDFTIAVPTLDSAAEASLALSASTDDGTFASKYAADVALYGDEVVSVVVGSLSTYTETILSGATTSQDATASTAVLCSLAACYLGVALCITTIWGLLVWDMCHFAESENLDSPTSSSPLSTLVELGCLSDSAVENNMKVSSKELLRAAAMEGGAGLDLLEAVIHQEDTQLEDITPKLEHPNPVKRCRVLHFGVVDCILSVLVLVVTGISVTVFCMWVPSQALAIRQNMTANIECQAQSSVQVAMSRLIDDMVLTTQRNIQMYSDNVTHWASVEAYSDDPLTTADYYTSSLPAVMLGILNSTDHHSANLKSIYAVMAKAVPSDPTSCSVFSAEWTDDKSAPLVGRMFDYSTRKCYQTTYSHSTGYSTWSEVYNGAGPLGDKCTTITNEAWYTSACSLAAQSSNVTVGPLNNAGMGIQYVERSNINQPAFGAQMAAALKMSTQLSKGKPVEGEVYVVSTTGSTTTLLSSTEANVALQLQAASSDVDPASAGGLTGLSASSLQSSLSTFDNLWSRSESIATATEHGQLAMRCPSSTTTAYIAIAPDPSSSTPSTSLHRFDSSMKDLDLMLVTTLPSNAYGLCSTLERAVTICLCVAASILAIALGMLPYLVIHGHNQDQQLDKKSDDPTDMLTTPDAPPSRTDRLLLFASSHPIPIRLVLVTTVSILVFIVFVLWTVCISNSHKDFTEDFALQIATSMNVALDSKFQDSLKSTRIAARVWNFTGQATSGLSTLDKWTTSLMQDFHQHSGLSTIQFATQMDGLVQGVNSTVKGVHILSRSSSAACLQTSVYNRTTDTSVGTHTDNCYFDPRYTTWYEYAMQHAFGDGAPDSATPVFKLYPIGSTGLLGAAAVEVVYSGDQRSTPSGVWATEFTLDSVGDTLSQLADGLVGTLFVSSADTAGQFDGYLLAGSGQSMKAITLCSTSSDAYIQDATKQIYDEYDHTFSSTDGSVLVGHNVVSASTAKTFSSLVNVISLSREQLYSKLDETIDVMLIVTVLSIAILLAVTGAAEAQVQPEIRRNNIESLHELDSSQDQCQIFLEKLQQWIKPNVLALEQRVRTNLATEQVNDREDQVSQLMRQHAIMFACDVVANRDTMTHFMLKIFQTRGFSNRTVVKLVIGFWSYHQMYSYNILMNILLLLLFGLEVICDEDESAMPADAHFLIQGFVVLWLGVDVICGAVYVTIRSRGDARNKYHAGHYLKAHALAAPLTWVLLAVACMSSDAPDGGIRRLALYIYPVLLVLRNNSLWQSLTAFSSSFIAAGGVLHLFFCLLLTTSAMSVLMLKGKYETGEYSVDNQVSNLVNTKLIPACYCECYQYADLFSLQYESMSSSLLTMFVYLVSGENYVEATTTAFNQDLWNSVFFIGCSLVGLFFLTSLFIEAFSESFNANKKELYSTQRQQEWCSLLVVMEIWMRHSHETCAFFDGQARLSHSSEYTTFIESGMSFHSFVDLMAAHRSVISTGSCGDYNQVPPTTAACPWLTLCLCQKWLNNQKWIHDLYSATANLIDAIDAVDNKSIFALLDVCADLAFDDLYEQLQQLVSDDEQQTLAATKRKLILSGHTHMLHTNNHQTKGQTSWLHGHCPENQQLRAALDLLSLESRSANRSSMFSELIRSLYLHKWRFNLIFSHLDVSYSGKLSMLEFEKMHQMIAMCGELASSNSLRVDAEKLMISKELSRFTRLVHQGKGKTSTGAVESTVNLKMERSFSLMDLQQVKLTPEEENEAIALFSRIDKPDENGVKDGKVDFHELRRALAKMASIKYTEEDIGQLLIQYDSDNDQTINLEEFKQLRRELKIPPLAIEDRVLFGLSQEQQRLSALSLQIDAQISSSRDEELRNMFYFASWINFLCMTLYYGGSNETALDTCMVAFSLFSCLEVAFLMRKSGITAFFSSSDESHDALQYQGTFVCVIVSLFGACNLILIDELDVMSFGTARCLTGFSILGIFTKSSSFARLLQTLFSVFRATSSLITAILLTAFVAALAAQDIVGPAAVDDDGNHYFGSLARSLSTMFRLFVGEGWHDVMFSASAATNYSVNFLFIAFMIVVALLCSQLLVGVIINLYTEVQKLDSERLYTLFGALYHELSTHERESIQRSLLVLNRRMGSLHNVIDIADNTLPCHKEQKMAALFAEIESDESQQMNKDKQALRVSQVVERDAEQLSADEMPLEGWIGAVVCELSEQQADNILAANAWLFRQMRHVTTQTKARSAFGFDSFRQYLAAVPPRDRPSKFRDLNVFRKPDVHNTFVALGSKEIERVILNQK